MKYRALIFDFDGTIADTLDETRRIYNILAPTYGYRQVTEDEVSDLRHLSLSDILTVLKIPKRRVPGLIHKGTTMMRSNMDQLKLIKGMKNTLEELKNHSEIFGILTSNVPSNVECFLKQHGINDLFQFISSTSKLTGKARHLKSIRKTFSLKYDEMIYIGDELRDMKAAQKAKIPHAAVTWGFNSRESLAQMNPTYLLDSPNDFLDQLVK